MIPSLHETITFYTYVRRARRCTDYELTAGDVKAALDHAARLATDLDEEPAALFFAFSKLIGPLGQAWPVFPMLMGRNHATEIGLMLEATNDELKDLAWAVPLEGLTFEHVRDWFAARLVPRT